ncbi:transcriptional regulator [Amycolatopsis sp. cg5]|uniref:transcriptional regulator n=1 Tax=Amycolatopsis sp. cg5 TaxID=3238802 RepID=UPI003525054D
MTCTLVPLDPLLTDPIRLQVVSLLEVEQWCWLGYLRYATGLREERLARHLRILREAKYVASAKGADSKGWVRLTPFGEERLGNHLTAMSKLLATSRELMTELHIEEPDWFEAVRKR